jgi:hypothetical protein
MNLKGFLDGLSQEKYLVYFVLLWAGTFFCWGISRTISEVSYINGGYDPNVASSIVYILANLLSIGAGIALAIVSLKLLNINVLTGLKRELMTIYFLLLWAGSMVFYAFSDIIWDATQGVGYGIIGILFELAAGGVLALFAWKLLQDKSSLEEKAPIVQTA